MQLFRKVIASSLVSMILLSGTSSLTIAMAAENGVTPSNDASVTTVNSPEMYEEAREKYIQSQLEDLYAQISSNLNLNVSYIRVLHDLSKSDMVYADEFPNIYTDLTVEEFTEPFTLRESDPQKYDKVADFIECGDNTIERPNSHYLPDALYNVCADIAAIMNSRATMDRGDFTRDYNKLPSEIREEILFCESVGVYAGYPDETVNKFLEAYLTFLKSDKPLESIVEKSDDGQLTIGDTTAGVFADLGFSEDGLETIAVILSSLSLNNVKSVASSIEKDPFELPYTLGLTTRENLMKAAFSIVGKCKYVWGGGHVSTGIVYGINPVWAWFSDLYGKEEGEPGYNSCIVPGYSWCPIHGEYENSGDGCLFYSDSITSIDDYADTLDDILTKDQKEVLDTEEFKQMFDEVNFNSPVLSHRLDGLDCSGYTSWLYNQVATEHIYDSGARYFIAQSGVDSLGMDERLLPGDVYSWGDHIIVIVGAVDSESDAYVMVEQSPNTVKFGVCYFNEASSSDIKKGKEIAREANTLLGNINSDEYVSSYNMDGCCDSTDPVWKHDCGRLIETFLDEDKLVEGYDKPFEDFTAQEVIQYVVSSYSKYDDKYLSGLEEYNGEMFSVDEKNPVASPEIDYTNYVFAGVPEVKDTDTPKTEDAQGNESSEDEGNEGETITDEE